MLVIGVSPRRDARPPGSRAITGSGARRTGHADDPI